MNSGPQKTGKFVSGAMWPSLGNKISSEMVWFYGSSKYRNGPQICPKSLKNATWIPSEHACLN